jgi:hypothetical protein
MIRFAISLSSFIAALLLASSCQKTNSHSNLQGDFLQNSGGRRMGVYWDSLGQWKNKALVPVKNLVTPVRVLNDPSQKHRIIAVSLPLEVTDSDRQKKMTSKWKDVYLLFPKERTADGIALEVRSPVGPRSFYGTLSRQEYPGEDDVVSFEGNKAVVRFAHGLNQFEDQQDKNNKAVLTPEVLAALYISSQAFKNPEYTRSVRQIIELSSPKDIENKLDDYMVKIPYVGTSEKGQCRVTLEIDGTGAVAGLSVGGEFHAKKKGVVMLMGLLPIPTFADKYESCSVGINRFYNGDGYFKTGIAKDNLEIDRKSGDMVLTRESEWRDTEVMSLKDCRKISTKIASCGDSLTVNFKDVWMALAAPWPGITEDTKELKCQNLRLAPEDIKIGKFVDPQTKNKILESAFFLPKKPAAN